MKIKIFNIGFQKHIVFILAVSCPFLLPFISCDEIGPSIDLNPIDTSLIDTTYHTDSVFIPQEKVVLIEDFTGQECVNCPKAHDSITSILEQYPENVTAIALYNYFQDVDEGLPLVTQDAQEIGVYLGATLGWPAGVIDRKDFDLDGNLTLLYTLYKPYTEEQLLLIPPCNIFLASDYDAVNNKLKVTVTIKYTSAVILPNSLSVALCEDSIVAFQITPEGLDNNYIQNHVLRDMLTPALGSALPENESGRVYIKEFSVSINPDWVLDNLKVVAFVHNYTDNKEVLQAAEIKID